MLEPLHHGSTAVRPGDAGQGPGGSTWWWHADARVVFVAESPEAPRRDVRPHPAAGQGADGQHDRGPSRAARIPPAATRRPTTRLRPWHPPVAARHLGPPRAARTSGPPRAQGQVQGLRPRLPLDAGSSAGDAARLLRRDRQVPRRGASPRNPAASPIRDLHLHRADRLAAVQRHRHAGHRLDRRQRRPDQEGLPAARGVPARASVGAACSTSRSSSASSSAPRRWSAQFPTGSRWCYFLLALGCSSSSPPRSALLLAAVNVYLRDVQYLVEIMIMILFWASPIVYSWSLVARHLDGSAAGPLPRQPHDPGGPRLPARLLGGRRRRALPGRPGPWMGVTLGGLARPALARPAHLRAAPGQLRTGAVMGDPGRPDRGRLQAVRHPQGEVAQGADRQLRPVQPAQGRLLGAARRRLDIESGDDRRPRSARTARARAPCSR